MVEIMRLFHVRKYANYHHHRIYLGGFFHPSPSRQGWRDSGRKVLLVGEDEFLPDEYEIFNGEEWHKYDSRILTPTPRRLIELCPHFNILAVRRKVVKEQWPKFGFYPLMGNTVYRQNSNGKQFYWRAGTHWAEAECLLSKLEPITPQRAFELTGDKSILGKEGDEKCHTSMTPMVASPAPGDTKGASSPAWIPVGERLPKGGDKCWVLWVHSDGRQVAKMHTMPIDVKAHFKQWAMGVSASGYISHWMYPRGIYQVPPPPAPKTQQEKDEEAFKRWWEDTKDDPYAGCISESQKQSWHAALAYARGGERII